MKRIRPGKMKTLERKAKALAAANRRAYLGVAISIALSVSLVILCISVVPTGSPRDMVKAQMVHVKDIGGLQHPDPSTNVSIPSKAGPQRNVVPLRPT